MMKPVYTIHLIACGLLRSFDCTEQIEKGNPATDVLLWTAIRTQASCGELVRESADLELNPWAYDTLAEYVDGRWINGEYVQGEVSCAE